MTTTVPDPVTTRHATRGRTWPVRAGIVALATAATALIWSIITLGLTVHGPTFDDAPPKPVGITAVAMATLVAGLTGWVLLSASERWARRPTRIWTPIAVATAVLSLGGPLSGSSVTAGDRSALIAAHLLVATIYIPLMRRTADDQDGVRP